MLEGDVSPWKLNCELQHNRRFGHFIPFTRLSLFILRVRNQLISSLGNVYSLGFSVWRRAGLGTAMQSQSLALYRWVSLALFPDCVFIANILVQMAPAHFYCSSTLTWTHVHSHMQECRSVPRDLLMTDLSSKGLKLMEEHYLGTTCGGSRWPLCQLKSAVNANEWNEMGRDKTFKS